MGQATFGSEAICDGVQVAEFEAVKGKLEEYRNDLRVAFRYTTELPPNMRAL